MDLTIAQAALLVDDYDKAIDYYTGTMKFRLIEDKKLSDSKRWVRIAPSENNSFSLLLAKASNPEQVGRIGNQTGGRVFLFLHTSDFEDYLGHLISKNVEIVSGPAAEAWGKVAVFRDLYGNLWDLIQPA